ncbi:tRNA (N(6)-L-threonylcarbamoyladenosine(37)-C(2))-methylthiotransferase MtaB [Dendrosporobacter sp. 1207_IL3150]|uniref:tRNA (N(6)-L-threonylcarbamoyladenosine(37)-C(2))- methylthiotransferase MtaB n=1 Tax=Dendrosporobacter sp. 1207_IL3150 TaxID=3084054 RepID=UPI002FD8A96F
MPRVALTTLGCKVNQFETEVMEGLFKKRNYEIGEFNEPADVYVINTCSVTHLGEKKSRQLIRRATRLNPNAIIAVTGCYSQISPEQVESIPGVNVIIGTKDRHKIVDLVEEVVGNHRQVNVVTDIMQAQNFEDIPLFDTPGRTRAFLKIQEGCTNFCTYCIIPYARGPLRSRSLVSILAEAQKLVAAGFKEIVLTGIHLGAYGRDLGGSVSLIDAIKTVLSVSSLARLRLGSLESIEVSDELIELILNDTRLCRHLHLPLQAGDNTVLMAMNRQYTAEQFSDLAVSIMRRVPNLALSTDIIVGFPGETEEMFNNGLEVVNKLNFAKIHVFPYSRRKGTPAADYPDQVPEEIKKHRVALLQDVSEKKADSFKKAYIGNVLDVLFETKSNKIIDGLTGNYLRVYADAGSITEGTICKVRLEKLFKDGLWGTIID